MKDSFTTRTSKALKRKPIITSSPRAEDRRVHPQGITGNKKRQETSQKDKERYRLLFNSMTEGFALHELIFGENGVPFDYRFLDINKAFEQLTVLKPEDLI